MDAAASSPLSGGSSDAEEERGDASAAPTAPDQGSVPEEPPGVAVVQLCDGHTEQVQVIQAPQASVIHTAQVATVAELEDDESVTDSQRRRKLLSRRPSYRKILNELSSDSPAVPTIDEEQTEEEAPVPTSVYQTSSGQYIAVAQGRAIQLGSPGEEALQAAVLQAAPPPGAAVLQAGPAPQQLFLQGGQVVIQAATGDIPAYQLRSPSSGLAQGIVMAASPGPMQSPSSQHAEEITRKREVRLMKNREAARECRRKKKEYVKCLENRVAVLENQNKTLIEELKALKDIYCHKAE